MRLWVTVLFWLVSAFAHGEDVPLVKPLRIEEIRCDGLKVLSCDFIRKEIYLEVGDVLNDEEINHAQRRLSDLRKFDSVEIVIERKEETALIVVKVVERRITKYLSESLDVFSSSYSAVNRIGFRVENIKLGSEGKEILISGGITTNFNVRNDGSSNGSISYYDPHLFGARKSYFALDLFGIQERYKSGVIQYIGHSYSNIVDSYYTSIGSESGVGLTVGRRFANYSYLSFRYSKFISSNYTTKYYDLSNKELETEKYSALSKKTFNYGWSSLNHAYFPTDGSQFNLKISQVDYNVGESFPRFMFDYSKFWSNEAGATWNFWIGGPSDVHSMGVSRIFDVKVSNAERAGWYLGFDVGPVHFYQSETLKVKSPTSVALGWYADYIDFGMVNVGLQITDLPPNL